MREREESSRGGEEGERIGGRKESGFLSNLFILSPLAGSFLTGAVSREKHNARYIK